MSSLIPALPASWAIASIADLLAQLDDGRVLHHGWSPQCQKVPAKTDSEWGVLKTTSVQAGAFCPEHNKRLPEKLAPRPNLEVRPGDLLLTCAGPRARCGVPCLVRETRPRLILSGKMYRFRAQQGLIEPRYLEAYLLGSTAQAAIDRMKTGISDSGLNLTHGRFRTLDVVLAPFREQLRIVDAIESYFTRLDDAVATLERVQRNLKRYRASVLKAAIEGRLVPTEAELAGAEGRAYEPAAVLLERILAERRCRWEEAELAKMQAKGKTPKDDKWKANYMEPLSLDPSVLPQLPEGWAWATVDQIAAVKGGITKGQKRRQGERYRTVPYLRVANVQRGFLDLEEIKTIEARETQIDELRLEPGDVLFNEGGDRDKLGRGWIWRGELPECIHQNHVFRARIYTADLLPELLSWYGNTTGQRYFFDEGKQTTNLASINMTKLRGLPVPIPPLAEQKRIRDAVEEQLSVADDALATTSREVLRCSRLRQSILKWAFEGRLVNQDPTDEPASQLLERIQAERESKPTALSPARLRRARATKDRP